MTHSLSVLRKHFALSLFYVSLALLIVFFVLLHTWGWGGHLDWKVDPISVFTSSAPGKAFGTKCMIVLGLIYITLAVAMVPRMPRTLPGSLACLALAISGVLLLFVARYPAPYKPPHQPQKTVWQVLKEKIGIVDPTPDWKVQEAEVAKAHDDMIRGSTVSLVFSQICLVFALWRNSRRAALARWTAVMLPAVALLFYGAFNSPTNPGLYQRIGFLVVLAWLWFSGRFFLSAPATSPTDRAPVATSARA